MKLLSQQQLLFIQVMGTRTGDEKKEYDPNDKTSLKKIVDYIIDKLGMGYLLYGKDAAGKSLPLVASANDVKDRAKIEALVEKLDVFLMTKEVTKRILAYPQVRG